jgi:hypothetical protein
VTEQPKIVKSFLSQHCIGYTANAESVTKYHVEYTDFSRGTLYGIGGQGSMRSPLRCWEDVPPIVVQSKQTKVSKLWALDT